MRWPIATTHLEGRTPTRLAPGLQRYDDRVSATLRILDASLNRAREALRVMEDAARFGLNDEPLCRELKSIRHDLRACVDALPLRPGTLEASRDISGDVGIGVSSDAEHARDTLLDVVIAAGKRLGESLRTIEEVSKTCDASVAARFQALRYRGYAAEQQLQARFASGRARQWRLCLLLTRSGCKRPWQDVLHGALAAGADCVQVREKHMDDRPLVQHVREVIDRAKPRAAVIVNDRVDVALIAGADGVHLGQGDVSIRDARAIVGRDLLIGASTHDLEEARAAVECGSDYCGIGAMFATSVKPDRSPSGPAYVRSFIEQHPRMPHLAIGGITPENVQEIVNAGAQGVAVSTAICAADDPQRQAELIIDALLTFSGDPGQSSTD